MPSRRKSTHHTLLMFHGITATSQSLTGTVEVLQQQLDADRVILPDLPFHGQGGRLPSYEIPGVVAWFDEVVEDALRDTRRLTIVAHSYSAAILMYWAQSRRELIPQLRCVAVAPPLRITRTAKQVRQAVNMLPKRLSWYTLAAPRVKPIIQAYVSAYPRSAQDRARIFATTSYDDDNYEHYVAQIQMDDELYSYLQSHPITEIHQQMLLVLFGRDLVVDSRTLAEELLERGPELLDIRFEQNAGHLYLSQNPQWLVSIIQEWAGSLQGGRAA